MPITVSLDGFLKGVGQGFVDVAKASAGDSLSSVNYDG